jgi:NAD-dependent deacetylase
MSRVPELEEMIERSGAIVFFGGAGVSTESGIPDFRGVDGLYRQKYKYPPEQMLSHTFFMRHTAEFFDFYRDKMLNLQAQPNAAHRRLAELERQGKLSAVVTQNIDGLHQAAGSRNVLELHGSVLRNYCMDCGKFYDVGYILESSGVPHCSCGGIVKPDVVLYEEGLNQAVIEAALDAIASADMLIVGGTSLTVYPAASLVDYYRGDRLVLINKGATSMDGKADLVIGQPIGETLGFGA